MFSFFLNIWISFSESKYLFFPCLILFVFRLEFDAYRSDLEELSLGPRDAVTMARTEAAQEQHQVHKEKYERLRSDVIIKLKFLEENKVSLCCRSKSLLFSKC